MLIDNKKAEQFSPFRFLILINVYPLLLLLEVWQHVLALVAEDFLHLVDFEE